jgi:hypothetical protein
MKAMQLKGARRIRDIDTGNIKNFNRNLTRPDGRSFDDIVSQAQGRAIGTRPNPTRIDGAAARDRLIAKKQQAATANRARITRPNPNDVGRKSGMTRAQRAGQQQAAQGANVTAGQYPGVMQTPTKPLIQPGQRISVTKPNVSGSGGRIPANAQVPFRRSGVTTPSPAPAGPLTDQQRLMNWAKENPILAGAGGLLGYQALMGNRGQGNVVVTR